MDELKESDADEIVFVVLVVGLGGGAFLVNSAIIFRCYIELLKPEGIHQLHTIYHQGICNS